MLDDIEIILVKLKWKLLYKYSVVFEKIRLNKVFEVVKWLVEYSDLFKNEGIEINNFWFEDVSRCI